MPAGIDHSIQIFRKIIGKDIIFHHKNILPTKLYSYATFVYINFIIVQYNKITRTKEIEIVHTAVKQNAYSALKAEVLRVAHCAACSRIN